MNTEQDRTKYIEALESRLREWQKKIEQLRISIESADPEQRPRLQRLIAELEDQRRTVEVRLEELRAFTRLRWRDLQENVERARHELEVALDDARSKAAELDERND